jgi:hypothetical protein
MAVKRTNLTLDSCYFDGNRAQPRKLTSNPLTYSGEGGSVYIQSSTILIHGKTVFVNNVVTTGQFDAGAGGELLRFFFNLDKINDLFRKYNN